VSYRKKLIEVTLPLEAINRACVEDKNRKTGHIRNLHKWFAPMPLPAWRAVLFASLIDDPGNELPDQEAERERHRLFQLIERLLPFEAINDQQTLAEAKAAIQRCLGNNIPTIADPFCGGGSTVVEAQRLGLPSFASDLNPLAVLITTMLTVIPPRVVGCTSVSPQAREHNLVSKGGLEGFTADVRYYAEKIEQVARKRIGHLYPQGPNGSTILAWRWARTVTSPDPRLRGAHTPLVSDWWLSKKEGELSWIEPVISADRRTIEYRVSTKGIPPAGTTGKKGIRCLLSGSPIPLAFIRAEGKAGRLGLHMLAFVTVAGRRRQYQPPDDIQLAAAQQAKPEWQPEVALADNPRYVSPPLYGMSRHCDLFTARQVIALDTFTTLVAEARDWITHDAIAAGRDPESLPLVEGGNGARAYADAVTAFLGLCVGKLVQSNNALVRWYIDARNGAAQALPAFDRNVIPIIWDFTEVNPFGGSVGSWSNQVTTALRALPLVDPYGPAATVRQMDARAIASVGLSNIAVATDPPYFDNIGYADLSDFFYVWLRRALGDVYPNLFATILTPKSAELIANPYRHGGDTGAAKTYFQEGFQHVFSQVAQLQRSDIPISIVYAFKQDEERDGGDAATGWDAMLEGLIESALSIVGTWPLRTNRATRMRGIRSNALASSIILVCRPRPVDATHTTRREFLTALKRELPQAIRALQHGNIAPVDLAQAAIGPGMAIFSRYAAVLEADGTPMRVRTALTLINQGLDELLAEQEGEFDADTRWALAWFEQFGVEAAPFGEAETLSKAKNTSVASDPRLTVWEVTQHLLRALEQDGEAGAAALRARVGPRGDAARDLAYRLYQICERQDRAQEALGYNSLVVAWPEIVRFAAGRDSAIAQTDLFA
jgi:putative DNA methylase